MSSSRHRADTGAARNAWIVALGSLAALAILLTLMRDRGPARGDAAGGPDAPALLVYCAAGIKPPVEAAIRDYEKEFDQPVQVQYGGSGTLLGNIRAARKGDLYIPADESYIPAGRGHGVLAEAIPLARQHPVILVAKGNPKGIRTMEDLGREEVRVALANPEATSIGHSVRDLLAKDGRWAAIEKHAAVFKPTVNDVANDVKLGAVDAGIVWNALSAQYPDLDAVRTPDLDAAVETVHVAVLASCARPTAALRLARYLGARDRGLVHFRACGYEPVEGDAWAVTPEVVLFSGAMLRPGAETTLREFEAREGCRITTVYNGCGILTAQMRAGQRPDAYFSCDTTFMDSVADLYLEPSTIVDNHLMILVQKGNPKEIRTVQDLLRPGLRVGLPHHEKSAMGNIAWKMLVQMGVYDRLAETLALESPTGDFLVNQLRTGSLDAIIACRSNHGTVREHLDAVAIDHPMAQMAQPYAVGRASKNAHMMQRLMDAIVTAGSRERFESVGFRWRYAPPPAP
jgi:ABC-type molybdate transport system substrate-binding protein